MATIWPTTVPELVGGSTVLNSVKPWFDARRLRKRRTPTTTKATIATKPATPARMTPIGGRRGWWRPWWRPGRPWKSSSSPSSSSSQSPSSPSAWPATPACSNSGPLGGPPAGGAGAASQLGGSAATASAHSPVSWSCASARHCTRPCTCGGGPGGWCAPPLGWPEPWERRRRAGGGGGGHTDGACLWQASNTLATAGVGGGGGTLPWWGLPL
mmetsp:Transcript_83313/g.169881  ORF Transcript_83313/g.169881 Transcript_83313/m.169881 type:complete len:213 (+) Transcript_83313:175-813(+)